MGDTGPGSRIPATAPWQWLAVAMRTAWFRGSDSAISLSAAITSATSIMPTPYWRWVTLSNAVSSGPWASDS